MIRHQSSLKVNAMVSLGLKKKVKMVLVTIVYFSAQKKIARSVNWIQSRKKESHIEHAHLIS